MDMGVATGMTGGGGGAGDMGGMGSAMSIVGTLFGSYSQWQAGQTQKKLEEYNAKIAGYQAQDAIERGDVLAARRLTQTNQTIGSIRAGMAAQGVDVNSGSAADVQANSAYVGALDAATIKSNAQREAWGYKVQAADSLLKGSYEAQTATNQAASTFLTGSSNLMLAQSGFGRSAMTNDPLYTRG